MAFLQHRLPLFTLLPTLQGSLANFLMAEIPILPHLQQSNNTTSTIRPVSTRGKAKMEAHSVPEFINNRVMEAEADIKRTVQARVMAKVNSETDWTHDMFRGQEQEMTKIVEQNLELGIELEMHATKIRKLGVHNEKPSTRLEKDKMDVNTKFEMQTDENKRLKGQTEQLPTAQKGQEEQVDTELIKQADVIKALQKKNYQNG